MARPLPRFFSELVKGSKHNGYWVIRDRHSNPDEEIARTSHFEYLNPILAALNKEQP